jgi:hypothetical protein
LEFSFPFLPDQASAYQASSRPAKCISISTELEKLLEGCVECSMTVIQHTVLKLDKFSSPKVIKEVKRKDMHSTCHIGHECRWHIFDDEVTMNLLEGTKPLFLQLEAWGHGQNKHT